MPKSSANSNANWVGADLERTISQPILATFNKISEEIRPLNTIILSVMEILFLKQYPYILSKALCRPNIHSTQGKTAYIT